MYLALDPGETTGWALFSDNKGDLLDSGKIRGQRNLEAFVEAVGPHTIIAEDFRHNPNVRQGGSTVPAARVLGYLTFYTRERGITLILQQASVKPIAYKWLGKENKHKHNEDAEAHGVYYLQKQGVRKSRILE